MVKGSQKQILNEDVANKFIEPLFIGDSVEWCCKVFVLPQKDGRSHRLVDLQQLNHCQSPFQLACKIPCNIKKAVLDIVDGYYAIPLQDKSKPLTILINQWGCYQYLGYLKNTLRLEMPIVGGVTNSLKMYLAKLIVFIKRHRY